MGGSAWIAALGEEVVYESRMHWLGIVAQTWIWIVAGILDDAGFKIYGVFRFQPGKIGRAHV